MTERIEKVSDTVEEKITCWEPEDTMTKTIKMKQTLGEK